MDDLVAFLRARLAEGEGIARAAAKKVSVPPNDGMRWRRDWDTVHTAPSDPPGPRTKVADCGHGGGDLTAHIVEWDPARVLREVEAKRRLVDRYAWLCEHGDTGNAAWVLPLLATTYADHPDYRREWAPDA